MMLAFSEDGPAVRHDMDQVLSSPAPTASLGPLPAASTFTSAPPALAPDSSLAQPRSIVRGYFGDAPWDALHALPTLYVVGGCAAVVGAMTFFLNTYILKTTDHVAMMAFGSYTCFSSYFMVYFFLSEYSTSFRRISKDKKFYTIANLMKAGVLAAITPFAVAQLRNIIVEDRWDTNTLRNLGCMYAVPDLVSLVVVRRMAVSTVVHHLCVVLFACFNIQNDYSQENVCRLIVVYAAFSTFGYVVYMLLASRFLGVSPGISRVLSVGALVIYVGCCALNWCWQVAYLRRLIQHHNHWSVYCYMAVISFVMWDDLTLNRWLLANVRALYGHHRRIPTPPRQQRRLPPSLFRDRSSSSSSPVVGSTRAPATRPVAGS